MKTHPATASHATNYHASNKSQITLKVSTDNVSDCAICQFSWLSVQRYATEEVWDLLTDRCDVLRYNIFGKQMHGIKCTSFTSLDLHCTLANISVLMFILFMLTVVLHIFITQLRTKNECSVLFGWSHWLFYQLLCPSLSSLFYFSLSVWQINECILIFHSVCSCLDQYLFVPFLAFHGCSLFSIGE